LKKPTYHISIDENALRRYEAEVDSLRRIALDNKKVEIKPFNPNYISDYKGALLGMSPIELDRLFAYRTHNKWVNSAKEFQSVTGVSDSLLRRISPYFKFPKQAFKAKDVIFKTGNRNTSKQDLNSATVKDLQQVFGLGNVLSKRIIAYREGFEGGFADLIELREVYGLSPETIKRIRAKFEIQTPRHVNKHNLNTATIDELVTVKYIDYEIAHAIIQYRILHEGFSTLAELSKVKEIPISKIDLIKLSLQIK
jgi:DNA uptake protein ComE-like DNA-binding protein